MQPVEDSTGRKLILGTAEVAWLLSDLDHWAEFCKVTMNVLLSFKWSGNGTKKAGCGLHKISL